MTVDFHCHIDLYPDPVALVEQVQSRGVATLSVTTTPKAFTRTAALAETAPMIATALGLHPELAGLRHREVELFEELLPSARFVGEIGLDGSVRFTQTRALQERVFGTILSACARAGGRVMSIHSRAATPAVLDAVTAEPDAGVAVLHWFTGSPAQARRAVEMGCWFSVNQPMVATATGRALVETLPKDRVVTETDGPFNHRSGAQAQPWDVATTVKRLATVWAMPLQEADALVDSNFRNLVSQSQT